MGKRGPQATGKLSFHKGTGQYYKKVNGRPVYYGTNEAEAYRRWQAAEAGRLAAAALAGSVAQSQAITDTLVQRAEAVASAVTGSEPDLGRLESLQPAAEPATGPDCMQAVRWYLADLRQNASPAHYIDAKRRLKHWLKYAKPHTQIASLTPETFQRYRDKLHAKYLVRKAWEEKQPKPIPYAAKRTAPGMAGSTMNKLLVLVKGVFNRAAVLHGVQLPEHIRCMAQLRQVTANKQEVEILTKPQVQRLLSSLDLKWKAIVLTALNMAGSNVDIAHLTWSHLRPDRIEYPREKNQHCRRFPLWKDTAQALAEWHKVCPSTHYVFTTTHGRPFIAVSSTGNKKDSLSQQFTKYAAQAGLSQSFNAIRKSVATVAAEHGANEVVIKMILGNASNEVWQHYGQALPETITKAMASVAKHYGIKA